MLLRFARQRRLVTHLWRSQPDIAIVIGRYVEQLYDEHDEHKFGEYKLARNVGKASTYEPTYYPSTAQDNQGLLNAPGGSSYPYTDSAHAFGSRA